MTEQLQELVTELIKIGDELEMYGRENEDALAFNLGQAVRSLGLMARIERSDDELNDRESDQNGEEQ